LKILIIGTMLAATIPAVSRTWTDALGRTFEADFIRMDGTNVIFAFPDGGRIFSKPLSELGVGDQAAVRGVGQGAVEAVAQNFGRPWTSEFRIGGAVACKVISEDPKTRRFVYESPGYRFTCDARVAGSN
jgi:hypothetical protein